MKKMFLKWTGEKGAASFSTLFRKVSLFAICLLLSIITCPAYVTAQAGGVAWWKTVFDPVVNEQDGQVTDNDEWAQANWTAWFNGSDYGTFYAEYKSDWQATASAPANTTIYPGVTLFDLHDFSTATTQELGDYNVFTYRLPCGCEITGWIFANGNEPDDTTWLPKSGGLENSSLIPEGPGNDFIDDRGFIVRLNNSPASDVHWFPGGAEPGDPAFGWGNWYGFFGTSGFNNSAFIRGLPNAVDGNNEVYEVALRTQGHSGGVPAVPCTTNVYRWVKDPQGGKHINKLIGVIIGPGHVGEKPKPKPEPKPIPSQRPLPITDPGPSGLKLIKTTWPIGEAEGWIVVSPDGFRNYGALYPGAAVLQEDRCLSNHNYLWGWFDDPAVTNYACGGWPQQGAVPYGPDANGLYMNNEIWSPWIPCSGTGSSFVLEFDVYRDLPLDGLVFYYWRVRSIYSGGGYMSEWRSDDVVYRGAGKDWFTHRAEIGPLIEANADSIQVALGVVDMCPVWCGVYGTGACHSHAPLIRGPVQVTRDDKVGPQWIVRDIDLWQDNFPEEGGISPTSYARCDEAIDILLGTDPNILPGDSMKVVVADPAGLAADNTGGRLGNAVYAFVKVTDRFGATRPYTSAQIQSPDNKSYVGDVTGFLRYPYNPAVALPAGWYAYRMDYANTTDGDRVKDGFCCDLMDLGSGATGPHYKHANENVAANVGCFVPGDVIHYILAAKNVTNQWSYMYRTLNGQGGWVRTSNRSEALASPMEWSVLPDAGRNVGDLGDILYVDDSDDRGGPAQLYFDWAFQYLGLTNRVDRFDVLGPSSGVGNSLASRVKNIQNQIIGDPTEIYQKILWNSGDLDVGLMGDGGVANGGSSLEKSNDFGLCYRFLDQHPDNPGWAYWGDDVAEDWANLTGTGAVNVKSVYMNHVLLNQDQKAITGIISPKVWPVALSPWVGETFWAFGGCAVINNFDVINVTGTAAKVSHLYNNSAAAPAAVYQATANSAGSTARFHLAGFAYDFIRDDDTVAPLDRVNYLKYTLQYFENILSEPIGIDPVAFANTLEDNYPNPFNPTTTIKYSIADRGQVTLRIYNAAGQLVRTLVNEEQAPQAGGFSKVWNGLNDRGQSVASGVYFYQLTAKNFEQTKKMVVIK